jgi:hypothetical protein
MGINDPPRKEAHSRDGEKRYCCRQTIRLGVPSMFGTHPTIHNLTANLDPKLLLLRIVQINPPQQEQHDRCTPEN